MVFKALSCIKNQLDSVNDTYATALVTYTLMLAKHSNASKMMKLLKDKAVKEGRVEIFSKPAVVHWYYFITIEYNHSRLK